MYVCSNLCTYVIVCMYAVMYIHIIPILSTVHYYNTYTILFVYIVRTCISTVVCKMQVWLHNYIDNNMVHVFYTCIYTHITLSLLDCSSLSLSLFLVLSLSVLCSHVLSSFVAAHLHHPLPRLLLRHHSLPVPLRSH